VAGKTGQDTKWHIQELSLFMWLRITITGTSDITSTIWKIMVSKAGGAICHNF
jgi:hypothetical protein